jgi:hypothetical protein
VNVGEHGNSKTIEVAGPVFKLHCFLTHDKAIGLDKEGPERKAA